MKREWIKIRFVRPTEQVENLGLHDESKVEDSYTGDTKILVEFIRQYVLDKQRTIKVPLYNGGDNFYFSPKSRIEDLDENLATFRRRVGEKLSEKKVFVEGPILPVTVYLS